MYDLCFRAVQGLPLPPRELTILLIESILSRILSSQKVVICGYVWMSNHVHMQAFSLDGIGLTRLHERLKKRLSDFLKRLLGLSRLRLWDDRTNIGEVIDLEAAINRIVYAFLNPVRAGLVQTIDDYKGCNTWREFLSVPADVNARVEKEVPWIKATDLAPFSRENPSLEEEHRAIHAIKRATQSRQTHTLTIMPFKWLQAFGITDPKQVEGIRQRIINRVRQGESEIAAKRKPLNRLEGFVVTDAYIPTKKERHIFVYASSKETRCDYLREYQDIIDRCDRCYELMKQGARVIDWPPECFVPPSPRLCNAF